MGGHLRSGGRRGRSTPRVTHHPAHGTPAAHTHGCTGVFYTDCSWLNLEVRSGVSRQKERTSHQASGRGEGDRRSSPSRGGFAETSEGCCFGPRLHPASESPSRLPQELRPLVTCPNETRGVPLGLQLRSLGTSPSFPAGRGDFPTPASHSFLCFLISGTSLHNRRRGVSLAGLGCATSRCQFLTSLFGLLKNGRFKRQFIHCTLRI